MCEELAGIHEEICKFVKSGAMSGPDIGPNISLEGGPESINLAHVRCIDKFSVRRLISIEDLHTHET